MPENITASQPTSSTSTSFAEKHKKNSDFQHLLKQYATAALGVVGVGTVANAQAPMQHILYTPADIVFDSKTLRSTRIPIDLNHGGKTNFSFVAQHFTDFFSGGGFAGYGKINLSLGANMAIASHAIPKGAIIDKAGAFKSGYIQSLVYGGSGSYKGVFQSSDRGPFKDVTNKYLGLRILVNGKMHEGWIRMTTTAKGVDIAVTITGYAYDTVPNELGLAAGQIGGKVGGTASERVMVSDKIPASLGALAAGSSAIPLWRH